MTALFNISIDDGLSWISISDEGTAVKPEDGKHEWVIPAQVNGQSLIANGIKIRAMDYQNKDMIKIFESFTITDVQSVIPAETGNSGSTSFSARRLPGTIHISLQHLDGVRTERLEMIALNGKIIASANKPSLAIVRAMLPSGQYQLRAYAGCKRLQKRVWLIH